MNRDELIKHIIDELTEAEELCKGPNYWKDRDPARYKKELAALRRERKTAGSKERSYQQVLQAKRREKGKPGTKAGQNGKSGHSSGHMKTDTGTAAKRYQNSEKKAGTKLSIDRKNNNKGYESGNTRNIPQSMNRGRHNADEKKVKDWQKKKKLKKSDFMLLLRARCEELGKTDLIDFLEKAFSKMQ